MGTDELISRYEAGGGHLAKANAEGLAVPPELHVALLTCMDSRIDVFALFGMKLGEAHVLRNAGGVVTDDVIRSLTISQRVSPPTPAVSTAFRSLPIPASIFSRLRSACGLSGPVRCWS